MNNIRNLKISKIFWKKITMHNENGEIKVILIKKNIFKDYKIKDENGNERKITDSEIESLYSNYYILDTTDTLSKKNSETNNKYGMYNDITQRTIDKAYEDQAAYYEGEISNLKRESIDNEREYQRTINSLEREKYEQISKLKDGMKGVAKVKVHREGYDVVYEEPNQLQRERGFTSISQKKYYSNDFVRSIDLKNYFIMLETSISKELVPQITRLQQMVIELENRINKLEKKYDLDEYIQAISYETRLITSFSNFINNCIKVYGNNDISYSNSYQSYGQGDEESSSYEFCDSLIGKGREICADLIGKYIGTAEKAQFLINTSNEDLTKADLTEKPKTM